MQGILFVIVVVFIGMGLRNATVVSTAIPLSILMTLALCISLVLKFTRFL